MKCIIAGSRTIIAYEAILQAMAQIRRFDWPSISEVVSGCASGADQLGEVWAMRNDVPVRRFPANWSLYGRSAGMRRNEEMAAYVRSADPAGACLVLWDGKSRGAKHMFETAARYELRLHVEVID